MKNSLFLTLTFLTGLSGALSMALGALPAGAQSVDPSNRTLFEGLESPLRSAQLQVPLSPGSCAELTEAAARLDCLKTRVQRQEKNLLPDVLAFLGTSPQTHQPPLAWLQAFNHPGLLRQLVPTLKNQTNPVIRQHLLLLFQYVLISHPQQLDAATRQALFDQLNPYLGHAHLPTRLQALDIWLTHSPAEALPRLKQMLASPSAPERALALLHLQRLASHPTLKSQLPPVPTQDFLNWTQQADLPLGELRTWTFHPVLRSGDAPQTLQAFLGQWLDSSPPDTVKLTENALLLLLKHPQPGLRRYALKRLALTGNPVYAPRLEAAFEDPDASVRLRAQESLTQLQKLIPVQQLESLKDPKRLPPDTAERIRTVMRNPDLRERLLEPAFNHLLRQPAMLEELWSLLETSVDPALQLKALKVLRQAPANWPLSRLNPLLEPSQDVRVRSATVATALQRPYTSDVIEFLRPVLYDPQVELQLEMLNYFFKQRAQSDARGLMELLIAKSDARVDRRQLSFDGAAGSEALAGYIARRLKDWIQLADPKSATLSEWLSWVRSPALPVAWKREILKHISREGRQASLLPLLRQLMQNPEIALDAEFALNAVESRVDSAGW